MGTAVAKRVTGARGGRKFRCHGGRIGEARPLQTEGEHDEEQDEAAIHPDECNASGPGQGVPQVSGRVSNVPGRNGSHLWVAWDSLQ